MTGNHHDTTLPKEQMVISIIGFLGSLWSLILYIQIYFFNVEKLFCDFTDYFSCSKVIGSQYSNVNGIPHGMLGMAFFGLTLGLTLAPQFISISKKMMALLRLLFAAVGLFIAIPSAYISLFVLQGVCLACTIIQLSCIIYFICALYGAIKVQGSLNWCWKAFQGLLIKIPPFGIIPFAAGSITLRYFSSLQ